MPDELKKALDDMAHWADGNPEFRAFLKGVVQGMEYNPMLNAKPTE